MFKQKILIERIYENQRSTKKKYPIEDGKIIIERGGKGKGKSKMCPPYDETRIITSGFWIFKTRRGMYPNNATELLPISAKWDDPHVDGKFIIETANQDIIEKSGKTKKDTTMMETITVIMNLMILGLLVVIANHMGVINFG